jgi:GNAT superfamily N-acetyltransferase
MFEETIMFTIRPFEPTEANYEAFAALERAVWPEYPDTVEEWKHKDATRDPHYFFQRFVVLVGDETVASGLCCEPWWALKPGKYFLNISVHPDARRQGIGTALYDHLLGVLADREPVLLASNTREDQADGRRFLETRGFQRVMRYPISHLHVDRFDPAPFESTAARVAASGIRIVPLAELAAVAPDWQRKFWDLDWELLQDVPSPDPHTRQSFENFQERMLGAPGFEPRGQFIALDGDRWVGLSGLWLAVGDPELLYTGLTGVSRSHRRRGIATALKVRAIAFARAYGAKIIETDNEENNPMYGLNLKLGFEPQPAWLEYEKVLA